MKGMRRPKYVNMSDLQDILSEKSRLFFSKYLRSLFLCKEEGSYECIFEYTLSYHLALTFSKGCGEKAMSTNWEGTQWLSLTQAHCENNSCKCP